MPNGSTIQDLGVEGYGEVVSRIEAKARIPELSVGDREIQLSAADSLRIPLAKDAELLIKDLATLESLSVKSVLPGLESIEQLVALKPRDPKKAGLDNRLVQAILDPDSHRLGLSWPHERLDIYGPVMSTRATGFGDRRERVLDNVPDIDEILAWLRDVPQDQLLARLDSIKIGLHSEPEPTSTSLVSRPVPLRRWIAFEVEENSERYCLHDGDWYRMDDRYLERIDRRVDEILSRTTQHILPPWPVDDCENEYNRAAATALSGYCMDRGRISTPLHSHGGIEPCDIFVPPGTLIHVKRGRKSAELSHLFAQGLVSTDSLARDENARRAWRDRVSKVSGGAVTDAGLQEVILAIGNNRPITTQSLFTFSKVNLVKQYDALRYLNVDVYLTTIRLT